MLDPTDYLAAIPQQTILRHKELVTLGKITTKTNKKSEKNTDQALILKILILHT